MDEWMNAPTILIRCAGAAIYILFAIFLESLGNAAPERFSRADFSALAKAVAAVKKCAPGKLAYINLFPEYATLGAPDKSQLGTTNYTEYLERFVAEVKPQVLSYDNYMVQYSDDLKKRDVAASYFRNLIEVRRMGQKYHLPCLQIVAANQLRPGHAIPSPANLSLQAYTTLAAGFRGVT